MQSLAWDSLDMYEYETVLSNTYVHLMAEL